MIKFAIVGAGGIAQKHAESLYHLKNAQIEAVIDIDTRKAQSIAGKYGGKVYNTLDECLGKVDAVSILTPPSTHRQLCSIAIKEGKHVFCEKPLATSVEDAEAIAYLVNKYNVLFMTGFNMRFREGYKRLKEAVESHKVGEPINYWCLRIGMGAAGKGGWQGYNWRTDPNFLCGMTVESLSHDIDMIRWIMGEIYSVKACTYESIDSLPGFDDNANVLFELEYGAIASIHASWSSHIDMNSRGIIGRDGTIIAEGKGIWSTERVRIKNHKMKNELIEVLEHGSLDITSYLNENMHFVECIEKGIQPQITVQDGLRAVEISNAILESARTNKTVIMQAR